MLERTRNVVVVVAVPIEQEWHETRRGTAERCAEPIAAMTFQPNVSSASRGSATPGCVLIAVMIACATNAAERRARSRQRQPFNDRSARQPPAVRAERPRTAISRARATERASNKFARFTPAMSSTTATSPATISRLARDFPTTSSCSGRTEKVPTQVGVRVIARQSFADGCRDAVGLRERYGVLKPADRAKRAKRATLGRKMIACDRTEDRARDC